MSIQHLVKIFIKNLRLRFFWLLLAIPFLLVGMLQFTPRLAQATPSPLLTEGAATTEMVTMLAERSLYERLGGYNAIAAVVDDALPRVVTDPKLAKYFVGLSTNSKQRLRGLLVDFICQGTGGPCIYTGRSMTLSHDGLGITDAEFGAFATDVIASLNKFNVPKQEKDELVAIVGGLKGEIVAR